MPVLSVEQLSKSYGRIRALNAVSFEVPKGSVFGILGPNGSGKTTLLAIITSVLRANAGSHRWFDETPTDAHRRRIGTLLETPNFYHYLSAVQNLRINAAIKGKGEERIGDVLRAVNLYERKDSAFSTYSLGMKQRLAIAAALLGDPEVLVFDEPTNGLDPVGIAEIRDLIRSLSANGKTIIMASHLLDEVQKVCTHVAILKRGELMASGSVAEIFAQDDVVLLRADDMDRLKSIAAGFGGSSIKTVGENLEITFPAGTADPAHINQICFNEGLVLSRLDIKIKSLETRFLELTNARS